ncbi:MAG: hypothetical protein B5M53_06145 [Candidatus Cloacimonas sp. 4484_209]|nr:MAG: hypothetical protein B5M53_06145 [Candidatus Cloacimonas sp. 4484_209]
MPKIEKIHRNWPQQFALKELVEAGVKFVLIRQPYSWEEAGDIDILTEDSVEVRNILKKLGYCNAPQSNGYIKYDRVSKQWIHLDVNHPLFLGNIKVPDVVIHDMLNTPFVNDEGIPCLSPADEAILYLFHAALDKGHFDPKYSKSFFRVDTNLILKRAEFYSFLPMPLDYFWKLVEAFREGRESEQEVIDKIRRVFLISGIRRPSILKRAYWKLRTFIRGPRPIVFVGPDGAGKSTLVESLAGIKWPRIRLQYMGPSRESEMRLVFRILMRVLARLRDLFSKKNPVGIFVRAGWNIVCYFDFLDRVWRHVWFCGSGGVVICDRYACDMFFRKPTKMNEFLFMKLFPKPRFAFLCVGEAETIYKRKAEELSPEEIASTITLYRKKLAQYGVPYIEINTTDLSPGEAIELALRHLTEHDWFSNKRRDKQ